MTNKQAKQRDPITNEIWMKQIVLFSTTVIRMHQYVKKATNFRNRRYLALSYKDTFIEFQENPIHCFEKPLFEDTTKRKLTKKSIVPSTIIIYGALMRL